MKYLRQLMIILIVYFIGIALQLMFNLPIPGTVIGLILLFLALYFGIVKVEMIEDICEVLISHMSFLFIPAGVGLITSFGMLNGKIVPFIVIVIISTCVVWIVTAYVVTFLRKVCSK
ncbi:MAG: CidA/LrgA family protein [Bacillota bacterium]|nr:CidA/LrgA family protein [Bacillota bacterium]